MNLPAPFLRVLRLARGPALSALGLLAVMGLAGPVAAAAAPPQRVVSLLPAITESICELQACDRLVGTDRFSNWPAAVRGLPKLGGLEDAQLERIVALKPDLVFISFNPRLAGRLQALGVPVRVLEPRSLPDTEQLMQQVAQALGVPERAPPLWQRFQQRLAAAAARVPPRWLGQAVYFEASSPTYAAGPDSFIGQVLSRLGLANVAPATMGPFPQLNPEFVVRAQPALLMATAAAVAEMPQRPGWGTVAALRRGHVCAFDPERWDLLVRPGPRLADGAEAVADCLQRLP